VLTDTGETITGRSLDLHSAPDGNSVVYIDRTVNNVLRICALTLPGLTVASSVMGLVGFDGGFHPDGNRLYLRRSEELVVVPYDLVTMQLGAPVFFAPSSSNGSCGETLALEHRRQETC